MSVNQRENKGALSRRNVVHAGTGFAVASTFSSGATAQLAPGTVWRPSNLMEVVMPFARIDLSENAPPERVKIVSEAIYSAMVEIANAPLHDKFQVVTRHAADEAIYPKEGYLALTYTDDLIQITWIGGRSIEVKKKSSLKRWRNRRALEGCEEGTEIRRTSCSIYLPETSTIWTECKWISSTRDKCLYILAGP
jgi:hypothetical protein